MAKNCQWNKSLRFPPILFEVFYNLLYTSGEHCKTAACAEAHPAACAPTSTPAPLGSTAESPTRCAPSPLGPVRSTPRCPPASVSRTGPASNERLACWRQEKCKRLRLRTFRLRFAWAFSSFIYPAGWCVHPSRRRRRQDNPSSESKKLFYSWKWRMT